MSRTTEYPPPYPHDPPVEIFPDVFLVRGSVPLNPLMRITRNMIVVRDGGDLSLIHPVRLDAAGEATLEALGTIRHLVRLSSLHGLDDAYYRDRYGARLWAQADSPTYPTPPIDETLDEERLPFPGAELFSFRDTTQAEGILLLPAHDLLVTADAVQHYGDYRFNNLPARLVMPWIGFPKTTIVGPLWLKMFTPKGGSLQADFERLLQLRFHHLVSAHGSLRRDDAHKGVEDAVRRAFR